MKAYRLHDFTGLDDLKLREEDTPHPQQGEVLVRVHAVSLNFRDIAMLRDRYPLPHRKGLILTSDGAGEVVEVGAGVDDLKVGDRIMGIFHPRWYGGRIPPNVSRFGYGSEIDGWLVERKVLSQEALVRIPDNLSCEEASTLPCAAVTAWSALSGSVPIRSGHTVLTQGTGGVSIFALQLAKAFGASVIATTSSAAKMDRLRTLGADEVLNYNEEPQWGNRARALTGGRGVDRVVEVGGGRNHRGVPPRGRSERGACLHRFPECREFEHRFLRVIRKRGEDPPHLGGKSRRSAGCRQGHCHGPH